MSVVHEFMRRQREHAQYESWMLRAEIAEPRAGWRERTACAHLPPAMFTDGPQWRQALAVCQTCPVRLDCLADAYRTEAEYRPHTFGMRGGVPARARRRYRLLMEAS